MTRSHKFCLGIIALLIVAILYVLYSYQTILTTEIGFVYHPETDQIYEVELSAWVGHETLSRRLIPISKVHYGVTGIGNRLGYLEEILNLAEEDRLLKQADKRAWLETRSHFGESVLREFIDEGLTSLEWSYIDIAYLIRTDVDSASHLLELLPDIGGYALNPSEHIFTVDAFLKKKKSESNEHEVESLTEALLIRGRVASYLRYLGVNDPYFSSANPY